MQQRRLGRTGHESSVAILGAAAFCGSSPDEAEKGFHPALATGVNHLDIAPTYGDAEVVVGPHVPAVRDRLFVAGKSDRSNPTASALTSSAPWSGWVATTSTSTSSTG